MLAKAKIPGMSLCNHAYGIIAELSSIECHGGRGYVDEATRSRDLIVLAISFLLRI